MPRAARVDLDHALTLALDALGVGVAVLEMHSLRMLYVNRALCMLFACEPDDLLRLRSLADVVAPEHAGLLASQLRHHDGAERLPTIVELAPLPWRAAARDDRPVPVAISAVPFDGLEGPRALAAVIHEITEPRLLEARLRYADAELERRVAERTSPLVRSLDEAREALRARDEFLAMVSHELRSPLTPLLLTVQGIVRGLRVAPERASGGEVVSELARVERQIARLVRIVDHVLDLSRMAVGQVQIEPEPTDFVQIVNDVVDRVRDGVDRAASPPRIRVTGPPHLVGRWDAARLDQVISNLLSNALKYGDGRPITVAVEARESNVALRVTDGGPGIAAEQRDRIFERFARGDGHDGVAGFGLGLWIVRQIAEAHGGAVHLVDDGRAGATFEVVLPRIAVRPDGTPR